MTLHALEDVEAWLDDMEFHDDNTPLWRGHRSLLLDDKMVLVEGISHVMGRCTQG
jgi:hypothetical protein